MWAPSFHACETFLLRRYCNCSSTSTFKVLPCHALRGLGKFPSKSDCEIRIAMQCGYQQSILATPKCCASTSQIKVLRPPKYFAERSDFVKMTTHLAFDNLWYFFPGQDSTRLNWNNPYGQSLLVKIEKLKKTCQLSDNICKMPRQGCL